MSGTAHSFCSTSATTFDTKVAFFVSCRPAHKATLLGRLKRKKQFLEFKLI